MRRRFHYGGQAVIEGVMMRGPKQVKVAVRRPDGEIVSMTEPLKSIYSGSLRTKPFIRGPIMLLETLALGIKALLYSAKVSAEAEFDAELKPAVIWIPVVLGAVFGLALFVVLPLAITHLGIDRFVTSSILSNALEGLIRLVIFIAYLAGISLVPDIRRVFAYHGAEHKTVNAYEAGGAMRVDEVQRYSTAHNRCGTGFLLIVLVIAVLALVFTGRPDIWVRLLWRLALFPVIAAVGYELIHFAADHSNHVVVRAIMAPSLALQSLTTRQPDASQIEVAIAALEGVIEPETGD